jgi:hypothetical protein
MIRRRWASVKVVAARELRADEDLRTGEVVLAHGPAHALLVLVPQRRVEQPVARVERGDRGGAGVVSGVREGAEPDRRNRMAVVQREGWDAHRLSICQDKSSHRVVRATFHGPEGDVASP